jgi:hypothetical protein
VDPGIDLSALQQVVGKYVDQYNLLVAAGPLTAATVTRAFVSNSKLASKAVIATGAWFAVKELSGPVMGLIQDQFGYLQSIFGSFPGF